jgi:hypothetical protein
LPYQPNLPMPYSNSSDQRLPAFSHPARTQRAAELEVFRYGVSAGVTVFKQQIDSRMAAQAAWSALSEEVRFLNDGLSLVGDSRVGQELLARKLNVLATANDWRISRDYGR